jgi:hypothetical protein
MLIAKGYAPVFVFKNGSTRRGRVLLHDEGGESWPYSSGLVVPSFKREGKPCDDAKAKAYYGSSYRLKEGSITLPPRDLSAWRPVGEVRRADYDRRGHIEPGPKKHAFGQVRSPLFLWRRGGHPILYVYRSFMRIELGSGCEWDWRGIVHP